MEYVTGKTDIRVLLNDLLEAVYGEEVRGAIHDSILQCYYDAINSDPAHTNMEIIVARGTYPSLGDRLNDVITIQEIDEIFEWG